MAKLEGVGAGEGSFEEALNVELLAATWFILADPKGLFTAGGEATLVKIPFKIWISILTPKSKCFELWQKKGNVFVTF